MTLKKGLFVLGLSILSVAASVSLSQASDIKVIKGTLKTMKGGKGKGVLTWNRAKQTLSFLMSDGTNSTYLFKDVKAVPDKPVVRSGVNGEAFQQYPFTVKLYKRQKVEGTLHLRTVTSDRAGNTLKHTFSAQLEFIINDKVVFTFTGSLVELDKAQHARDNIPRFGSSVILRPTRKAVSMKSANKNGRELKSSSGTYRIRFNTDSGGTHEMPDLDAPELVYPAKAVWDLRHGKVYLQIMSRLKPGKLLVQKSFRVNVKSVQASLKSKKAVVLFTVGNTSKGHCIVKVESTREIVRSDAAGNVYQNVMKIKLWHKFENRLMGFYSGEVRLDLDYSKRRRGSTFFRRDDIPRFSSGSGVRKSVAPAKKNMSQQTKAKKNQRDMGDIPRFDGNRSPYLQRD